MRAKNFFRTFLLLSLFLIPLGIDAGGIMLYEISSADTRLGSAGWSSRAEDPSTLFTNPAGMMRMDAPKFEFGLQAIQAHIVFDPNDETTVRGSDGDADTWLPSGSFFYVHPVNERFSLGFGTIGYFGADLHFNKNWVGRYYVTSTFLEGFSAIPAAALRINDCLSIGLGANVMYGIFREKAAINNALDIQKDGELKLSDTDITAGLVAGILFELSPCTRIGIQYLSPVKLQFRDTPKFEGIGPILTDILAATGLLKSKVHITARVPQNIILSVFHAINPRWSVMADAGWQQWSRFEKAVISLSDPEAKSLTSIPKYQDTWHIALGAEFHLNHCWTFSGGAAYDSSAVRNKNRTLSFPIGEQWRIGTGARWNYSDTLAFDFCYELQWSGNLPVNVDRGRLAGHVAGHFNNLYIQFFNANLTWVY